MERLGPAPAGLQVALVLRGAETPHGILLPRLDGIRFVGAIIGGLLRGGQLPVVQLDQTQRRSFSVERDGAALDHFRSARAALAACADDNDARERDQLRSEEHTSELQSRPHLVCRLLLEKKKKETLNASCRNLQPCEQRADT